MICLSLEKLLASKIIILMGRDVSLLLHSVEERKRDGEGGCCALDDQELIEFLPAHKNTEFQN